MIERIKELIAEADFSEYDDLEDTYSVHIGEIKKFTELVVKDCIDIIRDEVGLKYKDGGESDDFMAGHYAGSLLARVKIRQHFGVKE